jgi:hypothetical protein
MQQASIFKILDKRTSFSIFNLQMHMQLLLLQLLLSLVKKKRCILRHPPYLYGTINCIKLQVSALVEVAKSFLPRVHCSVWLALL